MGPGIRQGLGYEFVPKYEKGAKGKYQLVVSERGWKELKEKIRTITRKTTPLLLAERTSTERDWTRFGQLFSTYEFSWQTGYDRQLGAQPAAILHLVPSPDGRKSPSVRGRIS